MNNSGWFRPLQVQIPSPRNVFCYSLVILLPWVLYFGVLSGWWRWDDPMLLDFVLTKDIWSPLMKPGVWQELTPYNFTPLVFVSLKMDFWLFGLQPFYFYAHQLLVFSGVALLTYCLLRRWCTRFYSCFGVALFCLGAVSVTVANQLMTRHYLEGLFFFILALVIYFRVLERPGSKWLLASATAYFLAMTAKEIFLPLIFFVLVWPREWTILQRLRVFVPYLAAVLVYLCWRTYMLGGNIDGYGIDLSYLLFNMGNVLWTIVTAIFGDAYFVLLIWGVAGLFLAYAALSRQRLIILLVAAACLVAPLFIVAEVIQGPQRFFLLLWWVLAVSLAWALSALGRQKKTRLTICLLALVLLGTSAMSFEQQSKTLARQVVPFEKIGKFIWTLDDPESILYAPHLARNDWYMVGIKQMKKKVKPQVQGPRAVFVDPVQIAEFETKDGMTFWSFDADEQAVIIAGQKMDTLVYEWQGKKQDKALQVRFSYEQGRLKWEFGPYDRGKYSFLYRKKHGVTGASPLLSAGDIRLKLSKDWFVRVKYESPKGWITYSPWFTIKPNESNSIYWQRGKQSTF